GVQQVRLQEALLDDNGAARWNAFGVERTAAKSSGQSAIVNHVNVITCDFLAQFACQKRCPAIDGVAIYSFEDVLQDRSGDQRVENDGYLGSFYLPRTQPTQRPLGSDFSDLLGRFQFLQRSRNRKPIIALHVAVTVLRDGNSGQRTIGSPIFADEAVRVCQDLMSGGSVERATVGVLNARISVQGRLFGAARILNALLARQ